MDMNIHFLFSILNLQRTPKHVYSKGYIVIPSDQRLQMIIVYRFKYWNKHVYKNCTIPE